MYSDRRPSSAAKAHPVRRGAPENGCPSTRHAADWRSTGLAGRDRRGLTCTAWVRGGLVRHEGLWHTVARGIADRGHAGGSRRGWRTDRSCPARVLGRCSAAGLQPTLTLPRVTSMTARPLARRAGANHRCHDRWAPWRVLGHGVRHQAPALGRADRCQAIAPAGSAGHEMLHPACPLSAT